MKIIIIGNGISGSTAARFIRKWSNHSITLISNESPYPFSRTALMYVYMGHLKFEHTKLYEDDFWKKNNINLLFKSVTQVNPEKKSITLDDNTELNYDKLIIASGSSYNKFNWPGLNLKGVSGLYHLSDLEYVESYTPNINHAVIVGGGLIGIELAEMFKSRGKKVTMLVRESSFWNTVLPKEESEMINLHILNHDVNLLFNKELKEIIGDEKVTGIITADGEVINCDFVGLTIGVSPNISFLKSSGIEINRGVLVDENLQTSNPDVYAIGDCAELRTAAQNRRNIEAVWYTGRAMGQVVAHNICKSNTSYTQDFWFNSAKFFDIEYQIYGYVPNIEPEGIDSIFWQHEDKTKSIRIVFNKHNKKVLGFNLLGIRYRHEVCENWIKNGNTLEEVLPILVKANYDPEFFQKYENEVLKAYNNKFSPKLQEVY